MLLIDILLLYLTGAIRVHSVHRRAALQRRAGAAAGGAERPPS